MLPNTTILSASSLNGDDVKNNQGETLGEVKDIMIDTENGQVQYYVLSFGGFLGMGDKLFAVPPQAINVDTERKCLVFDIDKDRLENAPGFDKDNWPNMADESFRNEVYGHYGYEYRRSA
ncbi:PRC-barrel domain-containing protein [Sneathiella sp.]|uniref:PRC-barrel domain-containing protein n=1 Tax=Sneathiella sp. TaxID=1964365 RepID=UPI0035681306